MATVKDSSLYKRTASVGVDSIDDTKEMSGCSLPYEMTKPTKSLRSKKTQFPPLSDPNFKDFSASRDKEISDLKCALSKKDKLLASLQSQVNYHRNQIAKEINRKKNFSIHVITSQAEIKTEESMRSNESSPINLSQNKPQNTSKGKSGFIKNTELSRVVNFKKLNLFALEEKAMNLRKLPVLKPFLNKRRKYYKQLFNI